jgi:hypothetical protein
MAMAKKYITIPKDIQFVDPFTDKPILKVDQKGEVLGELEPYTFKQFLIQMLKNPVFSREGIVNLTIACNIMNSFKNLATQPNDTHNGVMSLLIEDYDLLVNVVKKPKYEFSGQEFTDYGLPAEALTPQIMPYIKAVVFDASDKLTKFELVEE